jgi:hypothetical protein
MRVEDALSRDQPSRLREIGRQARTPHRELEQIARRLERCLRDKGDLLRLLRNEARRRDAILSLGSVTEQLEAARHDDIMELLFEDGDVPTSASVIQTSRQHRIVIDDGNDPTPAAVDHRWNRAREVGLDRAVVVRLSSSLAHLHASLRPFVEPTLVDPQPHDFAYIASVARMVGTTSSKLLEAYHVSGDLLARAREHGVVVLIEDTEWKEKPLYQRFAEDLATDGNGATRPGQDVYARRSRLVSAGTGSPEELAVAAKHAEEIAALDEPELRRLQQPRELDPLELETRLEEIARNAGITVSDIRGRSREARLARRRREFVVDVGSRAQQIEIARALNRSRQWVSRILGVEGITSPSS